jgi:hypothetical protein
MQGGSAHKTEHLSVAEQTDRLNNLLTVLIPFACVDSGCVLYHYKHT